MTTIRIPPTLRAEANGQTAVEADGATVRDVLEDLAERFPALRERIVVDGEIAPYVNVYVQGEDVRTLGGLETPVRDGVTLILLPAMAGGSTAKNASHFPRVWLVPSLCSGDG